MPPHGLYQMPRHHASGQIPPSARPVFNSMDFDKETLEPDVDTKHHGENNEKKDKDKKKKKERQSLDARDDKQKVKASSAPTTPAAVTTPAATSSKSKKNMKKKSDRDGGDLGTSTQKRKRLSIAQADALITTSGGHGHDALLNGAQFLEGLKSSMGDLGASFSSPPGIVKPADRPLKKPKKSPRKSKGDVTAIEATKPVSNVASETATRKAEKKAEGHAGISPVAASPAKTPVSVPVANLRAKTPVPIPTATPPHAFAPFNTPIPLPQKSPFQCNGYMGGAPLTASKVTRKKSEVLVTETPSQMSRSTNIVDKTPIPFILSQPKSTPTTIRKKTKKGPTIDISPPSTSEMSSPTPTTTAANTLSSSGKTLLTSANLLHYKQALSDEPKPRPRGRSSSLAPSNISSDSNHSVKDMFARVNKPYTRSGAEIDPFVTAPSNQRVKNNDKKRRKGKPTETHDEADLQTFTSAFSTSQKTVNFTDEQEYLATYTAVKIANDDAGPLPCLRQATSCTPKREQILRLSKADPTSLLTIPTASAPSTAVLKTAVSCCLAAEAFLASSVAARVPVPLGRIDGVWKLYCPGYAEGHVDVYAFGQRTLSISPIAGFTSGSTYTARLSLPPRSMAFTILSFDVPPHASFRSTTLKTTAEGYKFEVAFLGNGYLKTWIDLQELLVGKKMEGRGGREIKMEFWGVREGATRWLEEVDELEVEGRRLFRAYDGE